MGSSISVLFKKIVIFLLFFSFPLSAIIAQAAITAAGSNGSGTGGSVSSSVGQLVYSTNTGTNGSVAQGVQQPYEISIVTGVDEKTGINLNFSAYPNPTVDYLTLKVENFAQSVYEFSLFDLNGKLIFCKKLENSETIISMKDFPPSVYFLKVLQIKGKAAPKKLKSFKIIKH